MILRHCLRTCVALLLWMGLVSGTQSTSLAPTAGSIAKNEGGKVVEAPNESRFVQVREHRIRGIRVTEVVLGQTHIDSELPLIVQFHGRASAPIVPDGDHADTPPVRLMLPWAPDHLGNGRTWFPISITEDYADKVLGHYITERVDQLAHVLKQFRARRPTEGLPLVTGFSQGGMLAFGFAVIRPSTIDAAFPLAGWLPPYLVEAHVSSTQLHPPVRALIGNEDPVVPLAGTRSLVDRLRALGVDATLDVFDTDRHEMTQEAWVRYKRHLSMMIERRRYTVPNYG